MNYGDEDATYQACGGEAGLRVLVDHFYDIMAADYPEIWAMHSADHNPHDRLARFLCGWTGGPNRYRERYGRINIPSAHAHLNITSEHRDQWLHCMADALAVTSYPESLKTYLIQQLAIPAGRVVNTS